MKMVLLKALLSVVKVSALTDTARIGSTAQRNISFHIAMNIASVKDIAAADSGGLSAKTKLLSVNIEIDWSSMS